MALTNEEATQLDALVEKMDPHERGLLLVVLIDKMGPDENADLLAGRLKEMEWPLPRVVFGPAHDPVAATAGSPARDGGPEAPESGPELLSSDYLYDYVVLGFLDFLGRGIGP